jgi:ATP-dependent Lon protease
MLDLPVLPVRDLVLFPHVVTPVAVDRERSLRAIDEATSGNNALLVVAQRDPDTQLPGREQLRDIGTEAMIGRVIKMPDGSTSVLVQGQRRVRLLDELSEDGFLKIRTMPIEDTEVPREGVDSLMRAVLSLYEKVVRLSRTVPDDHYVAAMNVEQPGWLADFVASDLDISMDERQGLLETLDPTERLNKASVLLARELEMLELQSRIHTQVQQEAEKNQREFYLREQIKAIHRELGENDPQSREVARLRDRIEAAVLPPPVRERALEELERLAMIPAMSPELGMIRGYLEWLADLPWIKATKDVLDIDHAAKVLDRNHHGLERVKERLLEFVAVRKLAGANPRSTVLCFVGPPGVGKTSLGRSIAEALGRKFVRVSLGGVRDEAEIRGHRRTYIGSMPGRILQTMRTAGTVNPVFVLDEIDKLGVDFRGDPASALLEVLDPEQNNAFSDHYLEVPYDLSKVMFVTTANMLDPVPPALRDRMEVIEMSGYIEDEKYGIARRFLVPRQVRDNGLAGRGPRFTEAGIRHIIRDYTREAGVRNLERQIGTVCRRLARKVATGQPGRVAITPKNVAEFLGPARFRQNEAEDQDQIGVATGVSWTPVGGDVMTVETVLLDGKGQLSLTGQLGDVMKESAQAALSYARSRSTELGIRDKFYETTDVHIHVPAGAIPKDGPSAGITIATAVVSALTHRPTDRNVAMTGEITLRGRVLPVGGVREKVIAAHRAGITTFVLPSANMADLEEVPDDARRALRFVPVTTMDEVLPIALRPAPAPSLVAV